MALSDSLDAIGAVTELLQTRLIQSASVPVDIGRPETAAGTSGRKLNLFLYRIEFDPSMRNVSLDDGQQAPIWLVLYYLLTAFQDGESDSIAAHKLLGRGMALLRGLNFVHPAATDTALAKNPEPLKITFDTADVDLLSKIMQGSDEKYRVSAAFQVRPILIAPDSIPSYAPLVQKVGPLNQGPDVVPSLGAHLDAVEPGTCEAGTTLTLKGSDLQGYDQTVIGTTNFPIVITNGAFTASIPAATALSAGAYAVAVSRTLASGHTFTSNGVLLHLLPKVTGVVVGPLTQQSAGPPPIFSGSFTISGRQLGGPDDSIFAALYINGATQLMLELAGTTAQTSLAATVTAKQAIPKGNYFLILRVNGEQAIGPTPVNWV